MIAVYLSKGNLLLPVMCIADEEECFQWKIFDQTTSVKVFIAIALVLLLIVPH